MNPLYFSLPILLLRVTLVLALCGAAASLLWRTSAALRHLLWTLGLAAALAVPGIWLLAPAAAWLPRLPSVTAQTTTPDRPGPAAPPTADVNPPSPPATTAAAPSVVLASGRTPVGAPTAAAAPPGRLGLPLVMIIWLSGTAAVLLPAVLSTFRLARRCRHDATAPDENLLGACRNAATALKLRRTPRLYVIDGIGAPLCFGFLRPTVALPTDAAGWDDDRLRGVLLHELAHVARRDVVTQWLVTAARAVYWFHPLVWVAAQQTARLREEACDDRVLAAGQPAEPYARTLLDLAAGRPGPAALAAGIAMARPSTLEHRLRGILDGARPRRGVSPPSVTR